MYDLLMVLMAAEDCCRAGVWEGEGSFVGWLPCCHAMEEALVGFEQQENDGKHETLDSATFLPSSHVSLSLSLSQVNPVFMGILSESLSFPATDSDSFLRNKDMFVLFLHGFYIASSSQNSIYQF